MEILENISLKPYNSFGIEALAKRFGQFTDQEQLAELLSEDPAKKRLFLGGGSNILLSGNFDGLVLKNNISGIDLVKEDERHVFVRVGAGENWHRFVLYCLERHWAGVENLSLIPGNVGASPMQNIGAYGVELKEVFYELEAFDLREKKLRIFTLNDCAFGYRESIFKTKLRDQFAILYVTFRLNKQARINTSYGAIEEELKRLGVTNPGIDAVSQAVINIRSAKLPDPARIGNAGSFFKNPSVPIKVFQGLQQTHPGIVGYDQPGGKIKLAAGWLIEQCGWKGYRKGDAGCHERQALVLVNYGQATGKEIYALSEAILKSVKEKFGVLLEREVNII